MKARGTTRYLKPVRALFVEPDAADARGLGDHRSCSQELAGGEIRS